MNPGRHLEIGIGEADITPPAGITGRLGLDHFLERKHPISARALAVRAKTGIIAQVTCELVGHTAGTVDRIYSRLENELGLDRDSVILTCIHSHCSPWTWDLQAKEAERVGIAPLDWRWLDKVVDGCVESVRRALGNVQPSILKAGSAEVTDVASNRVEGGSEGSIRGSICRDTALRAKPTGAIDPEVRILSVHNLNGEPRALFVNYACHPSGYGGGKTLFVSPDFPYHACKFVSEHFGRAIPMSYWQGCAGDINVGKFNAGGSEEEVQGFGERLAHGVLNALEHGREIGGGAHNASLRVRDLELPVGDWVEPVDEARTRFDEVSREVKAFLEENQPVPCALVGRWRMAIKRLDVCLLSKSDKMDARLYLWKLGDLGLLFVPGEWFVRHGQKLACANPELDVWTTTVTNMDFLYTPDAQAMEHPEWYGVAPSMRTISNQSVHTLVRAAEDMIREA